MADENYALKHELEAAKGNLHKRINEVDNKHTDNHNDLKLMLHTFMESQKPLNKSMDNIEQEIRNLNETMSGYNTRMTDIEYQQTDQGRRLGTIEQMQRNKNQDNTKIIVALISAIATLGAGAFGLAQFMF